jgi:hypothetical protein
MLVETWVDELIYWRKKCILYDACQVSNLPESGVRRSHVPGLCETII